MPAHKGHKKYGGREKGTPNKHNVMAREAFQLAFEGLNGVDGLIAWAQKNPTDFYKLYGRLIPVELQSKTDPITHYHVSDLDIIKRYIKNAGGTDAA